MKLGVINKNWTQNMTRLFQDGLRLKVCSKAQNTDLRLLLDIYQEYFLSYVNGR